LTLDTWGGSMQRAGPPAGHALRIGAAKETRVRIAGRLEIQMVNLCGLEIGFVWLCFPRPNRPAYFHKPLSNRGLQALPPLANWVCLTFFGSALANQRPVGRRRSRSADDLEASAVWQSERGCIHGRGPTVGRCGHPIQLSAMVPCVSTRFAARRGPISLRYGKAPVKYPAALPHKQ